MRLKWPYCERRAKRGMESLSSQKEASSDPVRFSGNHSTHFSGTRISLRVINLTFWPPRTVPLSYEAFILFSLNVRQLVLFHKDPSKANIFIACCSKCGLG